MAGENTMVVNVKEALKDQKKRRSAFFIVIGGKHAGQMYKLEADTELIIGRAPDAQVRVDDDGASRHHAKIFRLADGTVRVADLGSTNGTYFNGTKLPQKDLEDGDRIQIGSTTILKFSYQDALEEQFQKRLYESATRDSLTGCYNKGYFLDRLTTELSFADRHRQYLSLIMFDIDHFKRVNDTYGHQAGDHVLRKLAQTVQDCIRRDDLMARYGGEEFVILLREIDPEGAFICAERIRRRAEGESFVHEGEPFAVTISLGIAWIEPDSPPTTPDELIRQADSFLYKAKRSGRNRTECKLVEVDG